jgi:elongation factor 1 alpha-like protein
LNQVYPDLPVDVIIDKVEASKDVNMVIIGHVDAGKSTLMGHLLHKLGVIKAH